MKCTQKFVVSSIITCYCNVLGVFPGLDVRISLPGTPVIAGDDVTLSCLLGEDPIKLRKQILWYKHTDVDPSFTSCELIWRFVGDTVVEYNQATPSYQALITSSNQEDFTYSHQIVLKNVTDVNEGAYFCSVNITTIVYSSPKGQELSVVGKLSPILPK